jgi:hypothetical protein
MAPPDLTYIFVELDTNVPTWRTRWPAKELRRRGYQTQIWSSDGTPKFEPPAGKCCFVVHFVNKAWTLPNGEPFTHIDVCRRAREWGPVYVNFDDDWTRMLDVQARPVPTLAKLVHSEIPELTKMATKVIVSTPRLAEVFGRWNEVEVVPNYLPEWVFDLEPAPKVERIGWMGEMYLHGLDWNLLMPFAGDLPPLYMVGTSEASGEKLRSWGVRDVEVTGVILDQRKLYREMGRPVGAMVPLDDTPFNRGKSWTKPMEFMARGVPVVASPHREYGALNDLTGRLPTFDKPENLVEAVVKMWDERPDGSDLPGILRHAGMTMEQAGGDAWEKALA